MAFSGSSSGPGSQGRRGRCGVGFEEGLGKKLVLGSGIARPDRGNPPEGHGLGDQTGTGQVSKIETYPGSSPASGSRPHASGEP